jgi:hypothetical protein
MVNPSNTQDRAAEHLLCQALDLGPEHRSAFLDRRRQGQSVLSKMVEKLLAENERLKGFMSALSLAAKDNPVNGASCQGLPKRTRLGRHAIEEPTSH